FGFAENTDDLFVGKTLLHGDVLMWLMKTLLTSGCTNQRGAGHCYERWCHQYSEAGQSSQKASLWIKAILTKYDHSHTERDSGGAVLLFIHFL
ncbi:hypothetical protein, partial [Escherichia coli]|uniref:hypothetical protein n=2 Tax=Escherichia coli TaxID=562 RepID=UPI000D3A660D